jgi:hypothetical protein
MIIPLRPSTQNKQSGDSIENVEWVMIELNGELLKPLDHNETTSSSNGDDDNNDNKNRLELGSVKFDSAVSTFLSSVILVLYTLN